MDILMGIGNVMKGDDGIGVHISKKIKENDWLSLDCGTSPENFTSIIKKEKPDYLVLVDAADMNLEPGEYRKIKKEKIALVSTGTHALPLAYLMTYLKEYAKEIIFIGVQPKEIHFSDKISKELKDASEDIIKILKEKEFDRLKVLE